MILLMFAVAIIVAAYYDPKLAWDENDRIVLFYGRKTRKFIKL